MPWPRAQSCTKSMCGDADALGAVLAEAQPEVVFHLAAQIDVRYSTACSHDGWRPTALSTMKVRSTWVVTTTTIRPATTLRCRE